MVTNEFDCSTEESVIITFDECSGINELGMSNWSIYPNPSNGYVELELNSNDKRELLIEIVSLQGQVVYKETMNVAYGTNVHQLDLTGLSPQAYLIILKNNNEQIVKRLIIE